MSQYRIVTFLLNETTTLEDLQHLIEEKTDIPVHQQTITAFECRILNNKQPVLSQIKIQSEVNLKVFYSFLIEIKNLIKLKLKLEILLK